jgi:homocysteine S-methyltransferase
MSDDAQASRFHALLKSARSSERRVILDGALGTELDNRGADTSSPVWSGLAPLEHPELLASIHRDYALAGADIVTTCTFRTTAYAFETAGMKGSLWQKAASEAVAFARRAAGGEVLVAGSVGPLADCFSPALAPAGPSAEELHAPLMTLLIDAGVDVLWLETFGTLGELTAAMTVAKGLKAASATPFAVSVTTNRKGQLVSGEPLEEALHLAESFGAALFSVNCIPVAHIEAALSILEGCANIPLGVYANLGFAEATQDWAGSAHLQPEAYAEKASHWPVSLVGGCCGTTPSHIEVLKERLG